MSIEKKNKDHLKDQAKVTLVIPATPPKSDDPLRFWTDHPTEKTLIDLHSFADGVFENPHPSGGKAGMWRGPYTGRPQLINELAPAIQARCALLTARSATTYLNAIRAWWRLFDSMENSTCQSGAPMMSTNSVADLNELHRAAAQRSAMHFLPFISFLSIANDARRLLRLPALLWNAPKAEDTERRLIQDDQAREIKTACKQDWERVRRNWARNDAIRFEVERRINGERQSDVDADDVRLLKNWQHFRNIQIKTGQTLPSSEQLLGDWKSHVSLHDNGLEFRLMWAIQFPNVEEADIAFHIALMNSGWNPSTLINLDASAPDLVSEHPKDDKQLFLTPGNSEDDLEEVTMQADKPRARGKTQFCTGLKKSPSSPPAVVAAYLKRVELLREILKRNHETAAAELDRMIAIGPEQKLIKQQVKRVQELRMGCRSVWLYVDRKGHVNWLDWRGWKRYAKEDGSKGFDSYLDRVLDRVNARRVAHGKEPIPRVTPSDFRDIFARWVYVQSGGNVLAVMLALGHSSIKSVDNYLENNVFSAENDEHARRFMTHLWSELKRGRLDLAILAQLVRHGALTAEMEARLKAYRQLMRSRVGVGCADPRRPPEEIDPAHKEGRLCGTQRCLKECTHAIFLPESLDGIAMRIEELIVMSDHLPRETWLRGGFQEELEWSEVLLENLYPLERIGEARSKWRERIASAEHLIPGLGRIPLNEVTA